MSHRHTHRRRLIAAAALAFVLLAGPAQRGNAQEHRQLGAHQHGHGTLNIAIEGRTLEAELEVPGADIVGFEHPAASAADKRKIAAARKTLANPSVLLALPARAGCTLKSAKVALEGEEEGAAHHDEKHGEKHEGHAGEAIHSEFHVAWTFDCAGVAALTQIGFPYFTAFPNAQELEVTLITRKGQKTFEVNRKATRIDIADML
jgi:hypothetical protein